MLTIQTVREPAYISEDGQFIHMFVKFAEFDEELAYIAAAKDPEAHCRFLYEEAVKGVYGPIRVYTPPPEGEMNGNQSDAS